MFRLCIAAAGLLLCLPCVAQAELWANTHDFRGMAGTVRRIALYSGARDPNHDLWGLMGYHGGWAPFPHPTVPTICQETTAEYSHHLEAGERTWRCSYMLPQYPHAAPY